MTKRKPTQGPTQGRPTPRVTGSSPAYWMYGEHAVLAALANPRRAARRLVLGRDAARRHAALLARLVRDRPGLPVRDDLERDDFARQLPEAAVHQGIALEVQPLDQPDLEDLPPGRPGRRDVVVLLDQVTDPQNAGAVLRSAAAFGARAVVATDRNAASESGALAKAASGALEALPYIAVTNLVRALERLKAQGYWSVGLASEARDGLARLDPGERVALVLGAEGRGLRRLTAEHCDFLARLPTGGPVAELNVSNAAAVALYELIGRGS